VAGAGPEGAGIGRTARRGGWRAERAARLRRRRSGAALGQLRLQLLLQAHLLRPAWFDVLHTLWLPLGMVLLLAALLLVWTSHARRS
jgi:hypothetical protein